jgi:hypothetical protein
MKLNLGGAAGNKDASPAIAMQLCNASQMGDYPDEKRSGLGVSFPRGEDPIILITRL